MKRLMPFLALIGLLVLLPFAARAAEFNVPADGTVTINQPAKNVYTAGNAITTEAQIAGDIVAAGNSININSDIDHSVIAVAQSINLRGKVGQNARLGGNTITISSEIGEDLQAAGNSIVISKTALVGGDAMLAGSIITIDGTINGWLKGASETITINSEIKGDVKVDANNVVIGDKAIIGGKLTYKSNNQAQIASGAKIAGGVDFQKRTSYDNTFVRILMTEILTLALLVKLIGSVILLLLLIYLLPKFSQGVLGTAVTQPWMKLGIGLIVLIVTPITALLLLISTIGASIAFLLIMLYVLMLVLATHYGTLLIGQYTLKLLKKGDVKLDWQTAVVGVVAVTILALIPFIGPLAVFAALIMCLGSLSSMLFSHARH